MRRKLGIGTIIAATVAALAIGIGDIIGETDLLCSASACLRVHSSSFATAVVIPVGFYAAAFLFLAFILYIKGKDQAALLVLYALTGFEAYLTFIQVVFIHSLCAGCLIFFGLLLLASVAASTGGERSGRTNPVLTGFFMFFVAHFAFFFPNVSLRPTLLQDSESPTRVEVFASPSCPHCQQALSDLRSLTAHTNVSFVVRPVAISRSEIPATVDWVCKEMFRCPSRTARELAEKIVWENQDEAKRLNNGTLAVPIVVVNSGGHREIFRGWGPETLQLVREQLASESGLSRAWAAQENTPAFLAGREENHVCSTANTCGSATGIADN